MVINRLLIPRQLRSYGCIYKYGDVIAQFRYFKIQCKTIDITTRLRGINPTNSVECVHMTSCIGGVNNEASAILEE